MGGVPGDERSYGRTPLDTKVKRRSFTCTNVNGVASHEQSDAALHGHRSLASTSTEQMALQLSKVTLLYMGTDHWLALQLNKCSY